MKPFSSRAITSLAAASTLCFLAACSEPPPPVSEAPAPVVQGAQLRYPPKHPQLTLLGISTAQPSKAVQVEMPARLVWNEERTQRLYPAFAGRVAAIRADVGQSVKAGQILASLASPDFGVAQADTAKAQVDVRLTQKALARQKELLDAGIIARKDYEQALADAERSQAEVARAEARTKLYGSSTGVNQQLGLTASISGVVVERNLNPGQELRPDQSGPGIPAAFVISDPTKLWVQIDARESEVGTLLPGSRFQLLVPSLAGRSFEGQVISASDFIDPNTRTIKIRGAIDNPQRVLKAEMLASARIERQLGNGVTVPASSVLLQNNHHTVVVQISPGVFERREVKLSYQGPQEAVVSSGLEVGEQVVSENVLLLSRQMRLSQENASIAAASANKAVAKP